MKKFFVGVVSCVMLLLFMGCATIAHTSEGFGQGVSEDIKGTWRMLTKVNDWWKDYTW